ncbi:MAG: hypothetical protein IJQ23_00990 [Clostridia bacterium]|nr:hypothetical protein [Clostridia bacterium]
MRVRLDFTVSDTGLPAIIIIRNMSGELILYEKVYCRRNRLCFCSRSRNLIITVRPFDAGLYEQSYFIKFGRRACYNIRLTFNFTVRNVAATQTFYLFDENYSFPIERANLFFSGG